MTRLDPQNRFLPSAPSPHPAPLPAPLVGRTDAGAPAYYPTAHVPPPPPMPTLKLTPAGIAYLHQPMVAALGLRPDQPINLVPPAFDSLFWHLDLRDTARCRVRWYRDSRPRIEDVRLPDGLVTGPLTLYLLPGIPAYDGYYPLLPSDAFIAQSR